MKNLTHTSDSKKLRNLSLIFLLFFSTISLFSQNYRNAMAYIDDFGKNELYIKKAINDYTQTIVESQKLSRTFTTKETIIYKLKNINTVLIKNDKGFDGNVLLRDSFLKMSEKTIECLSNGSLSLNDYEEMSKLSISEIEAKLNFKERKLNEYYAEIISYENSKKEFGKFFNVDIRHIVDNTILEYNAKENFAFYKVNVADEKFINAINENDFEEVQLSLNYLKNICTDTYKKVNQYGKNVYDKNLNKTNLNMIDNIMEFNTTLFAYYSPFNKMNTNLINLKQAVRNNPKSVAATEYNDFLNKYNALKHIYMETYKSIQENKKNVIDKWYASNSLFLKRNMQFEDYRSSFAQAD
jgi:hypothetical protein